MKNSIIVGLLVIFLVACANTAPTPAAPAAFDKQKEVARLMSLSSKHTLTAADLGQIKTALADDDYALDELHEVEAMIKYQEYDHAMHALAFIDDHLQTGKMMNCPGHALGHYYVFMRHGEDDLAGDALGEAKEGLPDWQAKAPDYDKQYPGTTSYADADKAIQSHIAAIEAGNTTATDEEVDTLTNLICVEKEPEAADQ